MLPRTALLAVTLVLASVPRAARCAPRVDRLAGTGPRLLLRVGLDERDAFRSGPQGRLSTGFLVAIPPGVEPGLELLAESSEAVDLAELSGRPLPAAPARLDRVARVGPYRVARIEVARFTRDSHGAVRRHSSLDLALDLGGRGAAGPAAVLTGGGRQRGGRSTAASLAGSSARSTLEATLSALVVNPEDLLAGQETGTLSPALPGAPPAGCTACVKLELSRDGVYRVRWEDLAPLHPVYDGVPSAQLRLWNAGSELPIEVDDADGRFGPGDQLVFVGLANPSLATSTNVYWILPPDGSDGRRIAVRPAWRTGDEQLPAAAVTRGTLRFEEQQIYHGKLPNSSGKDPWMSAALVSSTLASEALLPLDPAGLDLPDLSAPVPGRDYRLRARVVGRVSAAAADEQELQFILNGTQASAITWRASVELEKLVDLPFDPRPLAARGNELRVVQPAPLKPTEFRLNLIDWVEFDYPRKLVARSAALDARGDPASSAYHLAGFSRSDARLYLLEEGVPTRLVGPRVLTLGPGAPLTLVAAWRRPVGSSGEPRIFAVEPAALRVPERLRLDAPSDLRGSGGADYVAISHPRFLVEAERLAAWRGGIAVSLEDVYDEFSAGRESAEALRDFLAFALTRWPRRPAYVVLIGDSSFDPRNHLGLSHPDYDPPTLVPTLDAYLEVATGLRASSDSALAAVVGADFLPDVAIGRIPARQAGQVDGYRQKLLAYETQLEAPWMSRIQLFADDDINDTRLECGVAGTAAADLDRLAADWLPAPQPGNIARRFTGSYGGASAPQNLQSDVIADLVGGLGVQVYLGHGNMVSLARHCDNGKFPILALDTLDRIANQTRQALGVAMTCDAGFFDGATLLGTETVIESIAERYVLAPDRGHVAWLATTAVLDYATGVDLTDDLFAVLYGGDPIGPPRNRIAGDVGLGVGLRRWADAGDAARDAVQSLVVLGDPSARLRALTP